MFAFISFLSFFSAGSFILLRVWKACNRLVRFYSSEKKNVCGGDSTKKLYAGDYGNVASTLKYCFYLFIYGLNHILLQFQSFDSVGRTIIWQDWFHFFFFYNFKLFSSIIARSFKSVSGSVPHFFTSTWTETN